MEWLIPMRESQKCYSRAFPSLHRHTINMKIASSITTAAQPVASRSEFILFSSASTSLCLFCSQGPVLYSRSEKSVRYSQTSCTRRKKPSVWFPWPRDSGPYWADGELQLIHTLKQLSANLLKHRMCSYLIINILEYFQIQFVMFKWDTSP